MEARRANKENIENHKYRRIICYILGILETLFAFRLIFKLLGANPLSGFVSFIYSLTGVFLNPFNEIFRSAVNEGICA